MSYKNFNIWIIAIVVLLVAFTTNPTQDDFNYMISGDLKQKMNITSNSLLENVLVGAVVEKGLKYFVHRRDFKFFSLYKVDLPGNENDSKYIGVFGTFLPIHKALFE